MKVGTLEFRDEEHLDCAQQDSLAGLFRCPECGGELWRTTPEAPFVCRSCVSQWPVLKGVPCFIPPGSLPEFQLTARMAELVAIAYECGWRRAIEQHVAELTLHKDHAEEYATSEARGDFLFFTSIDQSSTVLSIGSGWGNIELAFARIAKQVYALDTTLANLQFVGIRAQQEGQDNIIPVVGDVVKLPLPPASCDVVLMVGALGRIPWERDDDTPRNLQIRALENALKVLKPGGQLYIGIENRFSIKSFLGFREPHTGLRFIGLMPRWLADLYSRMVRRAPFREWTYSRRELRRLLTTAGFAQIQEYYPLPSYKNFRFITDFSEPWLTRFLANSYRGFGSFSRVIHAGVLMASLLRIEKVFSPCFSFIAIKEDAHAQ